MLLSLPVLSLTMNVETIVQMLLMIMVLVTSLHLSPLAAMKMVYKSGEYDICNGWFNKLNGCSIKKDSLDEIVYKYFSEDDKIVYEPPLIMGGEPSTTYFKLEYGGDLSAGAEVAHTGPHYCSTKSVDVVKNKIWGEFCLYISTGENSGKYRHPHLALATFKLWISNQYVSDKCPLTWLDSPNGKGYVNDNTKAYNIVWCEMDDNEDPMSQCKVPYERSINNSFARNLYHLADDVKPVKGSYPTELVMPNSVGDGRRSGN